MIAIWVAVIWGHSMMSSDSSSMESNAFEQFLNRVWVFLGGHGEVSGHLIRKAGHFTEFAILGALSARLLRTFDRLRAFFMSYAFFCGVSVAVVDETIQIFSEGRGPAVTDVLIDSGGMATGILLFFAVFAIRRAIRKKKEAENLA